MMEDRPQTFSTVMQTSLRVLRGLTSITVTIVMPKEIFKSAHYIDLTARGIGISIVDGNVKIRQANAFGYD